MSGKVTGWVLRHGPLDRTLLGVLVVLADAARNDGGGVTLGLREIAARARLSLSVASVRVNQAIAEGWIERVGDSWGNRPGTYRFLFPQHVDSGRRVRLGRTVAFGPDRTVAFGPDRTVAFGPDRTHSRYGFDGNNGNGIAPADGGGRGLSSTPDQIAGCPLCDEHGWLTDPDGRVTPCTHREEASDDERRTTHPGRRDRRGDKGTRPPDPRGRVDSPDALDAAQRPPTRRTRPARREPRG